MGALFQKGLIILYKISGFSSRTITYGDVGHFLTACENGQAIFGLGIIPPLDLEDQIEAFYEVHNEFVESFLKLQKAFAEMLVSGEDSEAVNWCISEIKNVL